jgi:thioredoxin 1
MNKTTVEITDSSFNELINANDTVAVDFWAEWCGPCKAIGPVIDELSQTYEGKALIGKLNVDEQKETALAFGITSIPTILFFKNGKLADSVKGAVPKSVIEGKLQAVLATT